MDVQESAREIFLPTARRAFGSYPVRKAALVSETPSGFPDDCYQKAIGNAGPPYEFG